MKKFTQKIGIASAAAVMLMAGARGTLAYLTDMEETSNDFTVGEVSIETLEKDYPGNDSPDVKNLVPNEEVAKNPTVDNKGVSDAVIFMTVDSPMEKITVVGDDGSIVTAKSVNELFWFKDADDAASVHANSFDENWQELTGKEMYVRIAADGSETEVAEADLASAYDALADGETLVKRYVFGYKTTIQGSDTTDGTEQTDENKTTSALFDKVQLKNVIENETDGAPEQIVLRTYAIQGSQILEDSADLAASLSEENLGKIYDVFVRQNSTGNDATGLQLTGIRDADDVSATSDGATGETDSHVNRYDTADDLSGEGDHVKPE
ncbi:MAG: SipW-dependent-type signal peptide-containing protein [Clostridiales bacterium]|nr:SipW-dependent-type signal peptide-containing protein [Clostridiales bacterium]